MNNAKIMEMGKRHDLPSYRLDQLRHAVFTENVADFSGITTLSTDLRETLAGNYRMMSSSLDRILVAGDSRAYKALLRLDDDRRIETVLLNPKPGLWSCCISSQVGCALKCSFCATGTMGFVRNLTSEEITDQVLFWRHYIHQQKLPIDLRNVVYMGMGEPLHNKKLVFDSLTELMNPHTFNIGARRISLSTVGLVPGIYEFSDRFPQVNLAISLHAANDELRRRLMPVNKAYPLDKLTEAMRYYIEKTNRKLFLEYILMNSENDSDDHACELVTLVRQVNSPELIHVNLIVYNETNSPHQASRAERARAFKKILLDNKIKTTIRKNLGTDINGACGQLVIDSEQESVS